MLTQRNPRDHLRDHSGSVSLTAALNTAYPQRNPRDHLRDHSGSVSLTATRMVVWRCKYAAKNCYALLCLFAERN
jgi:hypothetical protein